MYYTIIISSFAFLWSHGHNCDRDRFLPKLVVYSGVLVVVQVRISCIQRRISCIQFTSKPVPLIVSANVCMAVSKLFNCVEKQRSTFLRIFAA